MLAHLSHCSCTVKLSLLPLIPVSANAAIFLLKGMKNREKRSKAFDCRRWDKGSLAWQVENDGSDWNYTDNVACSGHLKSSKSCSDEVGPPSRGTLLVFSCTLGSELGHQLRWLQQNQIWACPYPKKLLCKAGLAWSGTWLFSYLPSPSPLTSLGNGRKGWGEQK